MKNKCLLQIFLLVRLCYNYSFEIEEDDGKIEKKRAIIRSDKHKWKFPIKYHFEWPINEWYLKKALGIIEKETCVTFEHENKNTTTGHRLNFVYSSYCGSRVGMISEEKPQEIYLNFNCMYDTIRIQSVVFHALGLFNEQCRNDRDTFVTIHNNNIKDGFESNFIIDNNSWSTNYNISYDYGSAMHSLSNAFSKDKKRPTITSKISPKYNMMMGQRDMVAFSDYKLVNLHYCNIINYGFYSRCINGGYEDPHDFNKCKCPHNFEGKRCNRLKKTRYRCGDQYYIAKLYQKQLFETWGAINCHYKILSRSDKIIGLKIIYVNAARGLLCHQQNSIEIKHRKDKAVMGLCLCGNHNHPFHLISEDNTVLVHFVGWGFWHKIKMYYSAVNNNETLESIRGIL
uniref:Metalloendopeptidase n=1 Tax=Parastrongyloides trichosuri TaxID=131310 RepID=A0A0N4Z8E8_PARTI